MPARAMARGFGPDLSQTSVRNAKGLARSDIQALIESPELRRIFDEEPGEIPDMRRAAGGRHRRDAAGQSAGRRAHSSDDGSVPRRRSRGLRVAIGLTPVYLAALLLCVEAVREPSLFPAFFGAPSAADEMSSRSGMEDDRVAEHVPERAPAVVKAAAAVAPAVPEKGTLSAGGMESLRTIESEKSASDLAKRGGGVVEQARPAFEKSTMTDPQTSPTATLASQEKLVSGRPAADRSDPDSGDHAVSEPRDVAGEMAPVDPAAAAAAEEALRLSRSDRREVQRRLQLAQFDPQLVDGIFGPATRTAITDWQEVAGLPATGYVDERAMALLAAQTSDEYRSWRAAEQARARRRKEAQSAVVVSSAPPVPATVDAGACRRLPSGELAFGRDVRCNFRAFGENVSRDFRGLKGNIRDLFD